ncbi:hypothetical protein PXNS11_210030 [Stutzerimonas xanthomarina]|nr:hypothetical protein PXNS11_210030 [Stutzerimonas xanthomarina]
MRWDHSAQQLLKLIAARHLALHDNLLINCERRGAHDARVDDGVYIGDFLDLELQAESPRGSFGVGGKLLALGAARPINSQFHCRPHISWP